LLAETVYQYSKANTVRVGVVVDNLPRSDTRSRRKP
jgi:hypothetical protein